jgi:hypothetical protein
LGIRAAKAAVFLLAFSLIAAFSACTSSPGSAAPSSAARSSPAGTEELPAIQIVNKTGFTIYYVRISRSDSDSWGQDWLGTEVLMNGRSVTFTLNDPLSRANTYDIRLEDNEGDTYTKTNVRVYAGSQIEFTLLDMDVGNTITNPNQGNRDMPSIQIVNNTGYTVYYVQISPVASDRWGADQLAERQVLRNRDSFRCYLSYPLDVVNRYDIRLKDEDGDTYTKTNVLVNASSRITFTISDLDTN